MIYVATRGPYEHLVYWRLAEALGVERVYIFSAAGNCGWVGLIRFRGHPALRVWVRRARADRTHGHTGLATAEREELARLRKRIASRGLSATS